MDLFTSRLDAERLARTTDPGRRAADRDTVLAGLHTEITDFLYGGRATVAYLGSETPRERIWLQMDGWADDVPAAIASWAAVDSLTVGPPGQHRMAVLGRARVAVVLGESELSPRGARPVPFLDAGELGVQTTLLDAMQRFAPSLVVHVQDWSTSASAPLGGRLVESFRMDPALHGSLPRAGRGRRFSRAARAYRAAAAGADWIVGARAAEYVRTLGHSLRDFSDQPDGTAAADRHAVHAVGPGRYVPTLPYRRLGGGSLGELALASCGAHAITLQLLGGGALERAALALAVAEGAIVHRMGLAREEKSE